MARKKLLTEGEIRQFMKLANLRPIGKDRLSEYGMPAPGQRDEEEVDMGAGMEVGDEMEDPDADPMADEPAMDMAPEGGGDMVSMDDFMDALERAIEEVTGEDADVSEEPGDEEDMEMDMELGGEDGEEPEMEMGMADEEDEEEEPMMEAERGRRGHGGGARSKDPERNKRGKFGTPDDDDDDDDESEVLPDDGSPTDPVRRGRKSSGHRPDKQTNEAIVNEVAKRVAARLQMQNRKEQMVDTLAERIMKRLTK
jgi:hypothetical protein